MTELIPERMQVGSVLAGRYRLDAVAGSGGMAIVWRAWDNRLGRDVAIKVMSDVLSADPAYVSRFAREAQIAAQISHPNLVAVYDFNAGSPQPYLVMQYVEGGTLEARLKDPELPVPELSDLAHDLLSALSAVHRHGVLHRDVKPANVLLGPDGRARLTDFGVARLEDMTRLTQTGHLVGTLRFLAPELVDGVEPSPQSDLYSLGILLREAAGARVEPPMAKLIDTLAATDPRARPVSAEAALDRLARLETGSGIPQEPTAQMPTAQMPTAQMPTAQMPTAQMPTASFAPEPTQVMGPASRLRRGLGGRRLALGALLAVAAVVVPIVLLDSGGASTPRSIYRLPRSPTLAQRLSALDQEVRSAPGS